MISATPLRQLENVLTVALEQGSKTQASGHVILNAMELEALPFNFVKFYALLDQAEEDSHGILNQPKLELYIKVLVDLKTYFAQRNSWSDKWGTFASYIETRGILIALNALANFADAQRPKIFVEKDFLEELAQKLEELLSDVVDSELSKELKTFLAIRLEELKKAVRRYQIDGPDGLEKVIKSTVHDFAVVENRLSNTERGDSVFRSARNTMIALLIYLTPTPYDLIGAIPDIHDFWVPKIQDIALCQNELEKIDTPDKTTHQLLWHGVIECGKKDLFGKNLGFKDIDFPKALKSADEAEEPKITSGSDNSLIQGKD